jgi:hypothetical protein
MRRAIANGINIRLRKQRGSFLVTPYSGLAYLSELISPRLKIRRHVQLKYLVMNAGDVESGF